MLWIHQTAMYLHIAAGILALFLFWVPVIGKKGSFNHKRFGRWFALIMYAVGTSGLIITTLDIWQPLVMHPPQANVTAGQSLAMSTEIRLNAMFLLSLSILVLATTRHGWLSIRYKEDRSALRRAPQVALNLCLVLAGLSLLAIGVSTGDVLMLVFGALEVWLAAGFLRYSFKSRPAYPRQWWTEHLGGLIASGIGAYTAFFVVGAAGIMENFVHGPLSGVMMFFWIAPGVIGGIAIAMLSRKHRQRFA